MTMARYIGGACGAWLLALAVPGIAAADTISIPGGAMISVQRKSIVDLRFVNVMRQRLDLSCGAAAIGTLLNYFYGEKLEEPEIISDIVKTGDKEKIERLGFSMLELKQYGERRGYVVRGFQVTKPEALAELKIPFLTLISSRGYNHFVIVKGVKDGIVYIADPAFGNRSIPMAEFTPAWSKVILVYLSQSKKPNNLFALEPSLRAPTNQIVQILDRYLTHIRPGGSQF